MLRLCVDNRPWLKDSHTTETARQTIEQTTKLHRLLTRLE
jgi:hypothetical protein